jgi:hypothetical protein
VDLDELRPPFDFADFIDLFVELEVLLSCKIVEIGEKLFNDWIFVAHFSHFVDVVMQIGQQF